MTLTATVRGIFILLNDFYCAFLDAYIDSKYESQDMPINYKHLYETNEEGFQLVEKFANSETFVFSQFYVEKNQQVSSFLFRVCWFYPARCFFKVKKIF